MFRPIDRTVRIICAHAENDFCFRGGAGVDVFEEFAVFAEDELEERCEEAGVLEGGVVFLGAVLAVHYAVGEGCRFLLGAY